MFLKNHSKFSGPLVLFLALTLVSCTKLEMMVHWADIYMMSQVTDYFDLSAADRTEIKNAFKAKLKLIQKEDFSVYAYHLSRLADVVEKDQLNASNIEFFLNEFEALLKKSAQKLEPVAQELISRQAKTNFERFDDEFLEKQKQDGEKAGHVKKIVKQARKKMARWIGESIEVMTDDQERYFNDMLFKSPPPLGLRVQSRQAVFEKFKIARTDPVLRQKFIRDFFYDWESLQTPEFKKARQLNREHYKNFLIHLAADLNPRQKRNFVKNLRKRSLELKTLSER